MNWEPEVRQMCLALPETYEEQAWVGTRWRVRGRTFAHVLDIVDGTPPAFATAAGTDGPAHVLVFRSRGIELDALSRQDGFFAPRLGTRDHRHAARRVGGSNGTRRADHGELLHPGPEEARRTPPTSGVTILV
ncbi:hypothetical protein [Rhodococcoides fascians]|uniref:hypothetical protein n=1 Tax=Rhodococcoides fascians TaxID=1828 RepID=UPI003672EA64